MKSRCLDLLPRRFRVWSEHPLLQEIRPSLQLHKPRLAAEGTEFQQTRRSALSA